MPKSLGDLFWTFPALAAFLGAFGGWCCKWVRRYALPAVGGVLAYAYGFKWYRCVGYTVMTTIAFSMGYSPDRNPWWVIVLVGSTYGLTPLILKFRWRWIWFPVLAGATLYCLMALSLMANSFTWKFVELTVFGLHGFLVSYVIAHRDD